MLPSAATVGTPNGFESASNVALAVSALGVPLIPSKEDASVTRDGNWVRTKLSLDCAVSCDCFSSAKKSLRMDLFLSVSAESFVTVVNSVL